MAKETFLLQIASSEQKRQLEPSLPTLRARPCNGFQIYELKSYIQSISPVRNKIIFICDKSLKIR